MTAFRWVSAIVSRTIFITASAFAGSVPGAGDSGGGAAVHAADEQQERTGRRRACDGRGACPILTDREWVWA